MSLFPAGSLYISLSIFILLSSIIALLVVKFLVKRFVCLCLLKINQHPCKLGLLLKSSFFFRKRSLLLFYQTTHSESNANGINSSSIVFGLLFGCGLCFSLLKAFKNRLLGGEEMSDEKLTKVQLPASFFMVVMCWVFICISWMICNVEARHFVMRKMHLYLRNVVESFVATPPIERQMPRSIQPCRNNDSLNGCSNCTDDSQCPNCIVQEVLALKTSCKTNRAS